MSSPDVTQAWSWFQKIAPDWHFDELVAMHHLRSRKRIYGLAEVVWLIIYQRLGRGGSLASAVYGLGARRRFGVSAVWLPAAAEEGDFGIDGSLLPSASEIADSGSRAGE